MSKQAFIRGALILTLAGIIVKVIGSVNRILLSRLLGGEGIGLYQMAYPLYLLALGVSSAGIPVAISIMVSERMALNDYRRGKEGIPYGCRDDDDNRYRILGTSLLGGGLADIERVRP